MLTQSIGVSPFGWSGLSADEGSSSGGAWLALLGVVGGAVIAVVAVRAHGEWRHRSCAKRRRKVERFKQKLESMEHDYRYACKVK